LTDQSYAILKGERGVRLRRDLAPARTAQSRTRAGRPGRGQPATESGADTGQSATAGAAVFDPADEALFEALRAWRAGVAKERGLPAYVVFHDATLRALSAARPATKEALMGISGIGQAKLEAYGDAVLALLAEAADAAGQAGSEPSAEPSVADADALLSADTDTRPPADTDTRPTTDTNAPPTTDADTRPTTDTDTLPPTAADGSAAAPADGLPLSAI
jgi:ATP-dependent DNA helicase RecQ